MFSLGPFRKTLFVCTSFVHTQRPSKNKLAYLCFSCMMHNVSKSADGKIWSTLIKYQQEVTFKNKKKKMYEQQIQTFDKQSVFLE